MFVQVPDDEDEDAPILQEQLKYQAHQALCLSLQVAHVQLFKQQTLCYGHFFIEKSMH